MHNYRVEGVKLQLNTDLPVASAHAVANPQFGSGGLPQYFIPDIATHIDSGAIGVVDSAGNALPVTDGFADLSGSIPLHNFDLTLGSGISPTASRSAPPKAGSLS